MSTADAIKAHIEAVLKGATIHISSRDDKHFEGVVISSSFEGQSLIEQHRLVMESLTPLFASTLHAFKLKTYTPEQWSSQQQ